MDELSQVRTKKKEFLSRWIGRFHGENGWKKSDRAIIKESAGTSPAEVIDSRAFSEEALQKATDIITVSEILGHTKPSTTLDMYGHTFDERKRTLMEQM